MHILSRVLALSQDYALTNLINKHLLCLPPPPTPLRCITYMVGS
jgi:hypothetical protein